MFGSFFARGEQNSLCSGLEGIGRWFSDQLIISPVLLLTLERCQRRSHPFWTESAPRVSNKPFCTERSVRKMVTMGLIHTLEHCLIPSFVKHFLQNDPEHSARRICFTSRREGEGPYGFEEVELDMVMIDDRISVIAPRLAVNF